MKLTKLFNDFFASEKAGGLILIFCTALSLALSNSPFQNSYIHFWHLELAGDSLQHWINDGLMTIFFLLIGLELEREMYFGELSDLRNARLPIFAAVGGMFAPAGLFFLLNYGTSSQAGAGIPIATDIAFALGILSLLASRAPSTLKVFLTALAVIDDLGAILVIAIFYTNTLSLLNLFIALAIYAVLIILNVCKVYNLFLYIIGGAAMWYFMLHSGIHATISGVLLAFAIPLQKGDEKSPSYVLQHFLHKPVAFFILPLFALANTGIILTSNWYASLTSQNSIGIITGLVFGKPLGILLFSIIGVGSGMCVLPDDIKWKHIISVVFLAGIGFTMSIFITLLAFDDPVIIDNSKIAILAASLIAAIIGFVCLKATLKAKVSQKETNETVISLQGPII
jgi:NhaA family Na+:H+ antiporter